MEDVPVRVDTWVRGQLDGVGGECGRVIAYGGAGRAGWEYGTGAAEMADSAPSLAPRPEAKRFI